MRRSRLRCSIAAFAYANAPFVDWSVNDVTIVATARHGEEGEGPQQPAQRRARRAGRQAVEDDLRGDPGQEVRAPAEEHAGQVDELASRAEAVQPPRVAPRQATAWARVTLIPAPRRGRCGSSAPKRDARVSREGLARAELHDPAVVEHADRVAALERGQPVGDDYAGPAVEQSVDGVLEDRLGGRVEAGRRLVEDDHRRVGQEGAAERRAAAPRRRTARPRPRGRRCRAHRGGRRTTGRGPSRSHRRRRSPRRALRRRRG